MPLLCCRFPQGEEAPPDTSEGIREPQPQRRNRGNRGEQDHGDPELPSSTVQALPDRVGPANPDGEQTYQYWPFSMSDLYNWKTQNPPFLEKPQGLTDHHFVHSQPHLGRLSAAVARALHHGRTGANPGRGAERAPGANGRPTAQPHLADEGGLTGILSRWKVGSVSECTARLQWLACGLQLESRQIWRRYI